MNIKSRILEALRRYLAQFQEETERTAHFRQFLENTPAEGLFDRKNFDGHITASAFVVSGDGQGMLLLHHKSLDKWLQPGGHVDPSDETLLAAALREVGEETGIQALDLQWIKAENADAFEPADIDSHFIPESPARGEAAHFHHDFRFLFRLVGSEGRVEIDQNESKGFRWVDFKTLRADAVFGGLVGKIAGLVSQSAKAN